MTKTEKKLKNLAAVNPVSGWKEKVEYGSQKKHGLKCPLGFP